MYKIGVDYNKQLLDEFENDIVNYQNQGLGYLPKPKAEADSTDTSLIIHIIIYSTKYLVSDWPMANA